MKFRHFATSFLATTAMMTTSFPAQAGPFDAVSGGAFKTPVLPAAVGNVVAPPKATQPTTPAANNSVGNSEISGLGDHQSWVDPNVLAEDPRALCSDIGLGNNVRTNSSEIALVNSSSTRSSSSKSHNDGGGGGVSIFGIGVNGSGSSQGSQNQSQSKDERSSHNEKNSSSSSTVVQGKNCDAFVNAAAARDMNYQDNLTQRYEIKVNRRGEQVDGLLGTK